MLASSRFSGNSLQACRTSFPFLKRRPGNAQNIDSWDLIASVPETGIPKPSIVPHALTRGTFGTELPGGGVSLRRGPDGLRRGLAEKTGKFLPAKTDKARGELLSWMFFVSSGVGPYFGQSVHFRVYAPEKISYATNRYAFEAQRHASILDARIAKQKYMLGDTYTIVDMNVWGWARLIPTVLGDSAWEKFPNLKRLVDEISARPAAQRAITLKDRHKFKTEMDAEAMQAMFPHLKVKVA
jgi:hypothetical protein